MCRSSTCIRGRAEDVSPRVCVCGFFLAGAGFTRGLLLEGLFGLMDCPSMGRRLKGQHTGVGAPCRALRARAKLAKDDDDSSPGAP